MMEGPAKLLCYSVRFGCAGCRLVLLLSICLLLISLVGGSVQAESMLEQSASRLITALGEKGYHDTAVAVLDQLLQLGGLVQEPVGGPYRWGRRSLRHSTPALPLRHRGPVSPVSPGYT